MNRDRVLAAWDELWSQMGREIMKGSGTLDVLVPLAKHEEAALAIVRRESRSDDFARRKVAAMLAGYLEGAPPDLLGELFELERQRDASLDPESFDRLEPQSVVEDIVTAALEWCQRPAQRSEGLALLREVIRRCVSGEYWNSVNKAIIGVVVHEDERAPEILKRFRAYCAGDPPRHPSCPSLNYERNALRLIDAKDPQMNRNIALPIHEDVRLSAAELAALKTLLEIAGR
jgi:hypothetical protein